MFYNLLFVLVVSIFKKQVDLMKNIDILLKKIIEDFGNF